MKRDRPLIYWIAGVAAVALVIAFAATGRLYSKWSTDQAVVTPEHVAITLVEEREEVHDDQAKYIFVFDIVFPKDCECTVAELVNSIPEDRWLAGSNGPIRMPPRNVRLVVTHLYNIENQTAQISFEMTSNDAKKDVVHKSTDTFSSLKPKFDAKSCKPKVALLPTAPVTFPTDLLVISTQNAPPGPSATHQLLTVIRVSGPGGSAPEVREDEFNTIAREYRVRREKNAQ